MENSKAALDQAAVKAVHTLRNGGNARNVGYSTFPNAMPASQEEAPYLGRTEVASVGEDELEDVMIEEGCEVGKAGIRLVMNATGDYLMREMAKAPRSFDFGYARFYPVMDGDLPFKDSDFDPERNTLYVAVQPSDAIRSALMGGSPSKSGGTDGVPSIFNVVDESIGTDFTVKNGSPFDILVSGATAGLPGDRAEMELKDGTKVPVSLEVSADTSRQRIVGRLTAAVAPCTDAKLTLWTHGKRTEGDPLPVSRGGITVLAGDAPVPPGDGPEITNGYSNGHIDDPGKAYGGDGFMLEGSRFGDDAALVSVKIGYTLSGQHRESEVAPEEMAVNDTYIEIYDSSVALMAALGAGGTITFTVETDAGISNVYTAQVVS